LKLITVALFFFFIGSVLNAQPLPIIHMGIKDGMSSNYVREITQDKRGFMWFVTDYGVNKFDGNQFTFYIKDSENNFINSNDTHRIAVDTLNNNIWIGNRWTGINVFDCDSEKFISFHHIQGDSTSLASDEITDILITSSGDSWISTFENGLELYDPKRKQFKHYNERTVPDFPSHPILSLAEDRNGNLYIGHFQGGLTFFSPKSNEVKSYKHTEGNKNTLPDNTIYCIYAEDDGKLWLATHRGLSLFDPETGTFLNFENIKNIHPTIAEQVNYITRSDRERIWVGTLSDLCYFDIKDLEKIVAGEKDVYHMRIQDIKRAVSNPTVHCIYKDSFNNIWIGSNGGGASFISNRSPFFRSWKGEIIPGVINGLSDKDACTVCVDGNGSVWVGTDGGGINVYTNDKREKVYMPGDNGAASEAYFSSLKDSNDDLWFGNYMGIDVFYQKEKRFKPYRLKNGPSMVYSLFEDSFRNIWIASDRGVEIYNLDTKESRVPGMESIGLLTNRIRSVSEDRLRNVWIGTLNKGICVYNLLTHEIKHFTESNGFYNNAIKHIFKDSRHRMWVATAEGLVMFPDAENDNYIVYNAGNGLACSYIRAIQEDNQGNIWVSTNFGISCFLESENRFLNYDQHNGALTGNYMNGGAAKTNDGTIYFGSLNGVCYFNPENRPENVILPPVIFTEFKIYEKTSKLAGNDLVLPVASGKITLNYNQDIFSVSFNIMDKALQGQIEYSYNLEGQGNSWINLGAQNQVTFRNIPYRSYQLKVKARLKNQHWPENYSTLNIVLNPPFWLTWQAKIIYLIFIISIGIFVIVSYKKRLEMRSSLALEKENGKRQQELNEERLRFYTNITHELRTPLTLILGPLEDLRNEEQMSKEQTQKLSLVHKSALRLLNLVNQILEFRKTETQNKKLCVSYGDITEILREIWIKYKELNRNEKVKFHLIMETNKTFLYFDPEIITIILDNLLSNAFKYTTEGSISLIVRSTAEHAIDYMEIEVLDTGVGISEEDALHIFERYYQTKEKKDVSGFGIGLALVNNLVKLHEGSVILNNNPIGGTSFRIRLMSANTYPNAIHIEDKKITKTEEEKINKPLILVVEDDNDIRDYVAQSLINTYDVIIAENGQQGMEMAMTTIPDIVISDIIMPHKNGIELCRELKQNVLTSHIPVILLTAKDTLQDKTEGYDAGADSYVTKPFSASLLRSRIINLLEIRKKIAALVSSNTSLKHTIIQESLNKLDNEFLNKVTKIVEDNLSDEKIDIPSIAHQLSMSYSGLYRKIKALTGMPAGEFVRKLKIRKAEQLLLSGKYNISEIAYHIGLNSVSYFRACFKEEYGLTPSEYLKKIKGEKKQGN